MSDNTNQNTSPRGGWEGVSEGAITVIKVGGAVVEDAEQLAALLENFSNIKGKKVLVHGGGRRATKVAASLGIESVMIGGRRVTDEKMLEVVTMVYGGLVNKNLVASLQARGVNAIGLTGADMNVIRSHKRPLKKMNVSEEDMSKAPEGVITPLTEESNNGNANALVDFGYVGDVDKADCESLKTLIEAGITPIMAPLTHDGNGNILNTNADTIASETAKALAAVGYDVTLIYSFEKKGVLSNPDDDDSVIPVITHESFEQYKADGTISGGMLPKIENALAAIDAGVSKVVITLATAIDGNSGTVIRH